MLLLCLKYIKSQKIKTFVKDYLRQCIFMTFFVDELNE